MNIYLAASYERRAEMLHYAEVLETLGHKIVSTWIRDNLSTLDVSITDGSIAPSIAQEIAITDLEDIYQAHVFILFTDGAPARGGRHFETGFAYEAGLDIIIVGPLEHVFHYHPYFHTAPNFANAIHILEGELS